VLLSGSSRAAPAKGQYWMSILSAARRQVLEKTIKNEGLSFRYYNVVGSSQTFAGGPAKLARQHSFSWRPRG